MRKANTMTYDDCDEFTQGYIDAACWTSDPDPPSGPYDATDQRSQLCPNVLNDMAASCADFQAHHNVDLTCDGAPDLARAGHDFWLTRNGHGAGYWDGDWPEPAATRLTDAAQACGEVDLYTGDDGTIYQY